MLLVQEYTFEIVVLKLWHIGSVSVVKSLTHHVVSEGWGSSCGVPCPVSTGCRVSGWLVTTATTAVIRKTATGIILHDKELFLLIQTNSFFISFELLFWGGGGRGENTGWWKNCFVCLGRFTQSIIFHRTECVRNRQKFHLCYCVLINDLFKFHWTHSANLFSLSISVVAFIKQFVVAPRSCCLLPLSLNIKYGWLIL